jgi:hypothetical protein
MTTVTRTPLDRNLNRDVTSNSRHGHGGDHNQPTAQQATPVLEYWRRLAGGRLAVIATASNVTIQSSGICNPGPFPKPDENDVFSAK